MSEIAALQATDRVVPLPPGLRRLAYAMFMELPTDVETLNAAEYPQPLPPRLATDAYANLMAAPTRQRRPMILRLVAASLAVALPASALIVGVQLAKVTPPAPFAVGPVDERRFERGESFRRGLPVFRSSVDQPVPKPRVQVPSRRVVQPPAKVLGVRTSRPPRPRDPAPSPPPGDLVGTVIDQVQQIADLACDIASTVVQLCGSTQNSPPILGPSD